MAQENVKYVCWNITPYCNLKCEYCFREIGENYRSLKENMQILHKLHEAGVNRITFSGGEPLTYPGILDLAKESKKLGIQTYIVSNGTMINENNIVDVLNSFDRITFSCDSPNSYVNEQSGRGINNYDKILWLCNTINEIRPGYIVQINSVVTRNNLGEQGQMICSMSNDLFQCGVKRIKFFQFYPIRGAAKEKSEILSISDEQFRNIENQIGKDYLFDVTYKDTEWLDRDCVVSPKGALKESENLEDKTLIEDILDVTPEELASTIDEHYEHKKVGVRHV